MTIGEIVLLDFDHTHLEMGMAMEKRGISVVIGGNPNLGLDSKKG